MEKEKKEHENNPPRLNQPSRSNPAPSSKASNLGLSPTSPTIAASRHPVAVSWGFADTTPCLEKLLMDMEVPRTGLAAPVDGLARARSPRDNMVWRFHWAGADCCGSVRA